MPPYDTGSCRPLAEFAANLLHLTRGYSLTLFAATALCCEVMNEAAQRKRGGTAYHSILEPHFDFIRELRQRRKTWKEIADALLNEKEIRVTLYAPYRFYQRQLKRRAKGHWEDASNPSQTIPAVNRPAKGGGQVFDIGEQISAFPSQTPKPQNNETTPGQKPRYNENV